MSESLNEFAINLPMTGVGAVGNMAVEPAVDMTASVAVPADVCPTKCNHISVSVDQATITNYDQENPCVCVDVVLSVSVNNPETGGGSTYKMVKRISFDKVKLALQAETMTPVQVVEAAEQEEDPVIVEQEMKAFYAAARAREMAGLVESEGRGEAKVLITYDDTSATQAEAEKNGASPARASTTLLIKNVKDKAHARHVFDKKHAHKYKNPKITRVVFTDPVKVE